MRLPRTSRCCAAFLVIPANTYTPSAGRNSSTWHPALSCRELLLAPETNCPAPSATPSPPVHHHPDTVRGRPSLWATGNTACFILFHPASSNCERNCTPTVQLRAHSYGVVVEARTSKGPVAIPSVARRPTGSRTPSRLDAPVSRLPRERRWSGRAPSAGAVIW